MRGRGAFCRRVPSPASLPPKTFDLIESLFTAFPVSPKKVCNTALPLSLKTFRSFRGKLTESRHFCRKTKYGSPFPTEQKPLERKGEVRGKAREVLPFSENINPLQGFYHETGKTERRGHRPRRPSVPDHPRGARPKPSPHPPPGGGPCPARRGRGCQTPTPSLRN